MVEPKRDLNPPPPISTPKEAPWTDVATIIELLKKLSTNIENLVTVLSSGVSVPGAPGTPGAPGASGLPWPLSVFISVLQRDAWAHDHVYVTTPGTAEQLPSLEVPPGFELVVRAFPSNTDDIYVGNSKANATLATKHITLAAGEAIRLKISNASLVWVDAVVADEGAESFVEV